MDDEKRKRGKETCYKIETHHSPQKKLLEQTGYHDVAVVDLISTVALLYGGHNKPKLPHHDRRPAAGLVAYLLAASHSSEPCSAARDQQILRCQRMDFQPQVCLAPGALRPDDDCEKSGWNLCHTIASKLELLDVYSLPCLVALVSERICPSCRATFNFLARCLSIC